MKVKELIEILESFNKEEEIYYAFPSGDYWGNTIAKEVNNVENADIVESTYHNAYKVIDSEKRCRYEEDEMQNIILIS